jgi:hypothetical protein
MQAHEHTGTKYDIKLPVPENIPLLTGLKEDQAAAVEKVLKGCNLYEALTGLGRFWKIKVWFNCEHEIKTVNHIIKKEEEGRTTRYYKSYNKGTVHVFNSIMDNNGALLYKTTRTGRFGYYFPSLESVVKYEPVIADSVTLSREFKSYEQFARKFDRRFITESEIQNFWNSKSNQHGGRYKPSDFHKIGPRGKYVLENFLRLFVNVETEGKCYLENEYNGKKYKFLTERYHSNCHLGRDITISHTLGQPIVHYSSEYPGCGNGRYGLLANKNEFLWLEDD